jgi:hypothetical protein
MEVDGLKPGTEPWIVNLRLAFPETGFETALNLQMVEKELNFSNIGRKVAANVRCADLDASQFPPRTVCFHNHSPHLPAQNIARVRQVYEP